MPPCPSQNSRIIVELLGIFHVVSFEQPIFIETDTQSCIGVKNWFLAVPDDDLDDLDDLERLS